MRIPDDLPKTQTPVALEGNILQLQQGGALAQLTFKTQTAHMTMFLDYSAAMQLPALVEQIISQMADTLRAAASGLAVPPPPPGVAQNGNGQGGGGAPIVLPPARRTRDQ